MTIFDVARTLIFTGNRLGSGHPEIYTSVVASAGTLAWGTFVAARKVHDTAPFGEDMSAVTGTGPLAQEARERLYEMDEHLSCRA